MSDSRSDSGLVLGPAAGCLVWTGPVSTGPVRTGTDRTGPVVLSCQEAGPGPVHLSLAPGLQPEGTKGGVRVRSETVGKMVFALIFVVAGLAMVEAREDGR